MSNLKHRTLPWLGWGLLLLVTASGASRENDQASVERAETSLLSRLKSLEEQKRILSGSSRIWKQASAGPLQNVAEIKLTFPIEEFSEAPQIFAQISGGSHSSFGACSCTVIPLAQAAGKPNAYSYIVRIHLTNAFRTNFFQDATTYQIVSGKAEFKTSGTGPKKEDKWTMNWMAVGRPGT